MGVIVSKKSVLSNSSSMRKSMRNLSIERNESENDQMGRKLWWSPKRSVVEIYNESIRYDNVRPKVNSLSNLDYQSNVGRAEIRNEAVQWEVSPRIDSLSNRNWFPSPSRVSIQHDRLKWKAHPKINSLDNVNYRSTGGTNPQIYDEKLHFKRVLPRINCGFIN